MRPPSVGDQFGPDVIAAVDPEKMKILSALMDDGNTIHFDPLAVAALGLGTATINQGPINMGYLADVVIAWAGGDPRRLLGLKVRFLDNVFAGDRLVAGGEVIAVDDGVATCAVQLRRGEERVLAGTARVLVV